MIPPPYAHLIRYHGLFAPNAKGRDLVPAAPVALADIRPEALARGRGAPREETAEGAGASSTTMPTGPEPQSSGLARSRPSIPPLEYRHEQPGDGHQPGLTGGVEARVVRPKRTRLPWAELLRRVFALDVLVCARCGGPLTVVAYITEVAVVAKILTHLGLPTTPPPLFPARRRGQMELLDDRPTDCAPAEPLPRRGGRAPPRDHIDRSGDDIRDVVHSFDWGA